MKKALAVLLVAQLMTTTAWAQEAPAVVDDADDGHIGEDAAPVLAPAGSGLEEIVVTARRRVESAQNVPVSVTAFSADDLTRRNLGNLEDVAATTPQLTVARSMTGSGSQITLRGIGSNPGSIGIEQSVAIVMDSVYYGQGRTINEGFFDLAGLEVLKGPQSLFFGKNATAGVISLTSADPGPDLEVIARAGYEFNAQQAYGEGIVSTPLSDTFGVRLALRASKQYGSLIANAAKQQTFNTVDWATGTVTPHVAEPGYREGPGEKELLGRLTLMWEPTDNLTAKVKASINRNDTNNGAWNAVVANCPTGYSSLDTSVACTHDFVIRQNFMPAYIAQAFPLARDDGASFNKYKSWAITGNVEYDFGPAVWTTVANYNYNRNRLAVDADVQSFAGVNVFATEDTDYHAFSFETRAQTQLDGALNGLVGFYYQKTGRDFIQFAYLGALENTAAPEGFRYVGFAKDSQTDGKTYSVYGQLAWKLVRDLELTAGARWIHETKDSYFVHQYADPRLATRYRVGALVNSDQSFDNVSPEVTLTWRPSTTVTVYGAYKSAYKSGGFSNSGTYTYLGDSADLSFKPETVKGGEIGFKTTLFDRQLRFNAAAYSYRYKNFQIDFTNSLTFNFITTNAGSVKQKGVEAEFQFAPYAVPGLTLRGSANYNRTRYADFIAPCYTGETPDQGCTLTAYSGTTAQDLAGRTSNNAPLWVGALGMLYRTDMGRDWDIELGVDGRYSGSYLANSFLAPISYQDSYVNLDATLRLTRKDELWQVALIGKNLTNNFVVTGAQDAPLTGSNTGKPNGIQSDQRSFAAMPRTVALQVTFHY